MKSKGILAWLVILILCLSLPISAKERKLTLKRAVQVSDTQIVMEFSEPIAINMHGENNGPYIAIRVVNSMGDSTRLDKKEEVLHANYNQVIQWHGTLNYVDEKHDRLVMTIGTSHAFGLNTISAVRDYEGVLSNYKDRKVMLVIEEVPFDSTQPMADNKICNITTTDGEVYLTPDWPSGWERVVTPFEVDFNYPIDASKFESKENPYQLAAGTIEKNTVQPEEEPVIVTQVVQNDPIVIATIFAGGVLVAVLAIVVAVVIRKRKGGARS